MKKTLKVKELVKIEKAIQGCGDVRAVKFAVGLSHNLRAIMPSLDSVRENLKNTDAMNLLNKEAAELMELNATKSEAERIAILAALKKTHKQAILDSADFDARNKEAANMEFEVDLYRIPLTYVPGWFGEEVTDPGEIYQKNLAGVVPSSSLTVLLEYGILYDPSEENNFSKKNTVE